MVQIKKTFKTAAFRRLTFNANTNTNSRILRTFDDLKRPKEIFRALSIIFLTKTEQI